MFPELDRDLKFGFQRNGSLVVARAPGDEAILADLLERGKKNGVQGLKILDQAELRRVEPLKHAALLAKLLLQLLLPVVVTLASSRLGAREALDCHKPASMQVAATPDN